MDATFILTVVAALFLVFGTIAIWILMGYYSVRILRSFRGGVLSKGWKYVSIAVPFLIFGQIATSYGSNNAFTTVDQEILRVLGASLAALGGLMIVLGFRAQYNAWNPKEMKKREATPEILRSVRRSRKHYIVGG